MAALHVGILAYGYQPLDIIGPLDILNSSTKGALRFTKSFAPIDDALIDSAPEFIFHHVGLTLEPVGLMNTLRIVPTTTVDDCPELDILILGGPSPTSFVLDPKFRELIRQHVAKGKLLFTTCTGSSVAAQAGVLDGKPATINNVFIKVARERFPNVQWATETKWVVSGNIWTGAGAVAGMDMVSWWIREMYGAEVVRWAELGLEFESRDDKGVKIQK